MRFSYPRVSVGHPSGQAVYPTGFSSPAGSSAGLAERVSWREGPSGKGLTGLASVEELREGDTNLSGETSFKLQPEGLSSSKPSPQESR